ncbi:TMEM231 [Symbiodinium pilosum]|uniref:Transmembrane protein 231 n=1 Tax=Symbiodinium pilosum TaxID=2952 RepID=A0A812P615_SYMPI|nr:TMEM231 [Symbiodinium pilosum]
MLTLIIVPLFATFAADNVWVKESFYRFQPVVTFTDELYVLVIVPTVRASTEDRNRDGIADTLQLTLEFASEGATFQNLLLLAVYDVQLHGKVTERLSGLVALDLSSPYAASGLWVQGQLSFRQKLPLHQSTEVRSVYSGSPLDVNWRSNWIPEKQPLSLQELLSRYAQRPGMHFSLTLREAFGRQLMPVDAPSDCGPSKPARQPHLVPMPNAVAL